MMGPIIPGTARWLDARRGCLTASRAPDLMRRKKNGEPTAEYHQMIGKLAVERVCDITVGQYVTRAMERGNELEAEALEEYSLATMCALGPSEFVFHPTLPKVGCTPDALVAPDGLVQTKVFTDIMRHIDLLKNREKSKTFEAYKWQLAFEMFCCPDRAYNDLAGYAPEMPPHLRLAIVRLERNQEMMDQIAEAIEEAEGYIQQTVRDIEACTPAQMGRE